MFLLVLQTGCNLASDVPPASDFWQLGFNHRPQQCLYFLPLPQGQGSLRPTFGPVRTGLAFSATAAAASLTTSLALGRAPPELAVLVPPNALAAWCSVCCGRIRLLPATTFPASPPDSPEKGTCPCSPAAGPLTAPHRPRSSESARRGGRGDL